MESHNSCLVFSYVMHEFDFEKSYLSLNIQFQSKSKKLNSN